MIIVGNGRVGGALFALGQSAGVPVQMAQRSGLRTCMDQDSKCPILICTNAGDLRGLIQGVGAAERHRLVFIQNGMIDDALRRLGCEDCTRGLLYFAVSTRGADIVPGGASIFAGPLAAELEAWFGRIGLPASAVSRAEFTSEMASKLIWNCTFGLLCDVHGQSVGALVQERRELVDGLVAELCGVANAALGSRLEPVRVSEDLCAYSLSIPTYTGSLKQWQWRNGWFVETGRVLSIPTPIHSRLLVDLNPA